MGTKGGDFGGPADVSGIQIPLQTSSRIVGGGERLIAGILNNICTDNSA